MIKDEFNQIKVNNDAEAKGSEFGPTQNSEFSENGEMHLHRSAYNPNLNKKVDNTTNIETSSTTGEVASSAASSEAASTVTASSSAGAIAATSSTVVVAASTVAITAISVATGISVALHDYQYKFNSFIVSSDQLSYEILITDLKQKDYEYEYEHYEDEPNIESQTFTLHVFNSNYDKTDELWLGTNWGEFTGLTLGETYNIVLSESRYGGKVLFEETFTTVTKSYFSSFDLYSEADFVENKAYIWLDYIDENNVYDNFALTLSNENETYVFPIEITSGSQSIFLFDEEGNKIDLSEPYHYVFSYVNNGETVIFKEDDISFHDISGGITNFYNIYIQNEVDFNENEFIVRLDFRDDYNYYSDFILNLTNDDGYSIDLELDKTLEDQIILAAEYDISFEIPYTYTLSCLNNGVRETLETGELSFVNTSPDVSEFYGLIFTKYANFLDRTFEIELDYRDDYSVFSDFQFILDDLDTKQTKAFFLEKTTEIQTITVDEYELNQATGAQEYLIDIVSHPLTFTFQYYDERISDYVVVHNEEELVFTNSLQSTFDHIDCEFDLMQDPEYPDIYLLPFRLVFDDAQQIYENFSITIVDGNGELWARVLFSEEGIVLANSWLYGEVNGMEGHTIEDIAYNFTDNLQLVVTCDVHNDRNYEEYEEVEMVRLQKIFTIDEIHKVYGMELRQEVTMGNYEVDFMPIYSGASSLYEQCFFIVETYLGHKYRYECSFNEPMNYSYVSLLTPSNIDESFDGSFSVTSSSDSMELDIETLNDELSHPVIISLEYIQYQGMDEDENPIYSEVITVVCYASFTFELTA